MKIVARGSARPHRRYRTFEPNDAVGSEEGRVESDIKPMNMKHRQGVQQNIVRREGPDLMKGFGVGQEIFDGLSIAPLGRPVVPEV